MTLEQPVPTAVPTGRAPAQKIELRRKIIQKSISDTVKTAAFPPPFSSGNPLPPPQKPPGVTFMQSPAGRLSKGLFSLGKKYAPAVGSGLLSVGKFGLKALTSPPLGAAVAGTFTGIKGVLGAKRRMYL